MEWHLKEKVYYEDIGKDCESGLAERAMICLQGVAQGRPDYGSGEGDDEGSASYNRNRLG